ncbi:MAG TPA: CHAT domain-containing tetratricopeptide repeat protein [Bryobacteraceae bacterium]|nr:CHAT domain-containing tetratricopeptide repeat protein [Bryobacteraceae bacterium]
MRWAALFIMALQLGAQSEQLEPKVEAARASGDRRRLAQVLLETGQASLATGDYPRAVARGEEAGALFAELRDPANEALALNTAGSGEVYRGNYPAAIAHYQQALTLDRSQHDAKGEINRLNNIAGAYFFQGKYLDALQDYQTVLRRAEENVHEPWGANRREMALTNLAVLYEQLGQNQKALEYYREALAGQDMLEPAERGQLLSNAGTLYRRLGDAVKALETYRRAQEFFAREHLSDSEIHVLQNIGIALALDMQDPRAAGEAFAAALVKAKATENQREIVLAHLFRGESAFRMKNWQSAKEDFTAALEGARAIGAMEEQWTALYGIARIQRQAGQSSEALTTLRETIGVIEAVRSGLGASALKAEYLGNKRDVYDSAISLRLEQGASADDALFHLFEQARSRNLQDVFNGGAPASLQSVQARLGDALLIEYWAGDGKLASFWVTKDGCGLTSSPWSTENDAAIESLVSAIRGGAKDWEEAMRRVSAPLLGRIPELSKAHKLVIVPDGALSQVPFEVLAPVPNGPSLVETAAVSYLPSAALLLREERRITLLPPWRRQWVGFGDPILDPRSGLPGDEQWQHLPESARELRGIADALPGRTVIYAGTADQKRYLFAGTAAGARILHFATHAVADSADPNRSRILFTPEPGNQGSEYLFRPEVQALALPSLDLVTLSACDTETGKLVKGEGVQNFSRAFLAAGARSTVTTLWRVEDRATADFMQIFYQHLAGGETKSEALREAKLSFLNEGGPHAHPRFWAAFVLSGDGQSPIQPVFRWSWVGAVVLAVAAQFMVFRFRSHHLLRQFRRRFHRQSLRHPHSHLQKE